MKMNDEAGLAYMLKQRKNIVIACEDLDFIWDRKEVKEFRYLWRMGFGIGYMQEHFERDTDEVLMLILDQSRKELIEPRPFQEVFKDIYKVGA